MKRNEKVTGKREPSKICLIAYPFFGKNTKPALLLNLMELLKPISSNLYVITGGVVQEDIPDNIVEDYHLINFKFEGKLRRDLPIYIALPIWLFNYIMGQIKMSYNLLKIAKNINIVIFFLGYDYILPILMSKILRKKTVMVATISSKSVKVGYNKVFYYISRIIEKIVYALSDVIIVYTENIVQQFGLGKHIKKISILRESHINFDLFKMKKDLKDKRNIIGYIGRLSLEKGVLNFAKAIPLILKERDDLEFLIGGDGLLFDEIKNELKRNRSYDKVEFAGWIDHDELPKYLNELKLIVTPSYTEGGVPAIIREGMACGTIVLVTPVGAGVDVIKDGETGFILANNSPECIAKNVIRILEHTELEKIVNNARNLVEEKYSFESTVMQYRNMLYGVLYDLE